MRRFLERRLFVRGVGSLGLGAIGLGEKLQVFGDDLGGLMLGAIVCEMGLKGLTVPWRGTTGDCTRKERRPRFRAQGSSWPPPVFGTQHVWRQSAISRWISRRTWALCLALEGRGSTTLGAGTWSRSPARARAPRSVTLFLCTSGRLLAVKIPGHRPHERERVSRTELRPVEGHLAGYRAPP